MERCSPLVNGAVQYLLLRVTSLPMENNGFRERRAKCFSYPDCNYDPASGVATLSYGVDGQVLQEKITFPWAPWPVDASRQAAFFQALELLHLIAGISYYKAGPRAARSSVFTSKLIWPERSS